MSLFLISSFFPAMHTLMTTSGDLVRYISRAKKYPAYYPELSGTEEFDQKVELILGKELDHLTSSARSPFMQANKLREIIALNDEISKSCPRWYKMLIRMHNWVQYSLYRDPSDPDYCSKQSA
jgi:hypothetical protein